MPRNADDWKAVETFHDFVELLRLLAVDWDEDEANRRYRESQGLWAGEGESWAHGTPGQWMEATSAWLSNQEGSTSHQTPEATWRTFAWILSASRGYE
jgi:hypothetical protein